MASRTVTVTTTTPAAPTPAAETDSCCGIPDWAVALILIPLPLVLGLGVPAIFSTGFNNGLPNAPSFMPPSWAFGVVWSTLYLIMGVALFLVYKESGCSGSVPIASYVIFSLQLAVNIAYFPVATTLQSLYGSTVIVVYLLLFVPVNIILFYWVRPVSGILLLPYETWLGVATALSLELIRLNPNAGWYPPQTTPPP